MSVVIAIVPFIIAGTISAISGGVALASANENKGESSGQQTGQKTMVLDTIIRNEQLLQKTLQNLGAKNINTSANSVQGNIDQFHIVFEKNNAGSFNIKFIGEIEQQEAEKFRIELQEEYGRVVQDYVYNQLKQKAEEKGLSLEKENIQNDRSIVLTYNINTNA